MKRMLTVAVFVHLGRWHHVPGRAEFARHRASHFRDPDLRPRLVSASRGVNEPVTTYEERRALRDLPDAYRENRDYRSSSSRARKLRCRYGDGRDHLVA